MARRFDAAHEQSSLVEISVFIGIAGVVLLSALGLVVPMVLSADRLRNKVIDLFMDVPLVVVRKLRGLTRTQLELINAEVNDDDERQREIQGFEDESQVSTRWPGNVVTGINAQLAEYQLGGGAAGGPGSCQEEGGSWIHS